MLVVALACALALSNPVPGADALPDPGEGGAVVVPLHPVQPPPARDAEPERRWITHELLPNQPLEQVAARYGVTLQSLKSSNDMTRRLRAGRKLRVLASRFPRPYEKVEYTVKEGDEWVKIAVAHDVRYRDLRGWNWANRKLKPGSTLTIWVDPDKPHTVYREKGPPMPAIVVREGAMSRGRPQKGWLDNAVRLPESHLYTLEHPNLVWGSSHAVRTVLTAIARFRHDSGYEGKLIIGSMSRRRGGKFPPHASHRTGRDIDIFLPLLPGVPFTWKPNPFEVDWEASWALLEAFVATGEVEGVFLDHRRQRFLYEAGRQLGADEETLAKMVEWPAKPGEAESYVRHGKDHTRHFHIRIKCGEEELRCYSRWGDERFWALKKLDEEEAERTAEATGR